MPSTPTLARSLQRVVDHDEQLAGRFPQLALAVHTAVIAGRPFDEPQAMLHQVLAAALRRHTDLETAIARRPQQVPATATLLLDASTAQHRTLAAHLDELARASTGLDAVAITRTLHALLTVHRDLENRILDALHGQAPTR